MAAISAPPCACGRARCSCQSNHARSVAKQRSAERNMHTLGSASSKLAARSLVPFVHPDHGQRPIGAGGGFDDRRRPRAARRGMRKDHRHHQRAEAGIVQERIEAKSERLGCLQHFGGEIGRIGDRAEIRDDLMQRASRSSPQAPATQRHALRPCRRRSPPRHPRSRGFRRPGRRSALSSWRRTMRSPAPLPDCRPRWRRHP